MAEFVFKDLTLDNAFDLCSVLDAIGTDDILNAFNKKELASLNAAGKDSQTIGTDIAFKIVGIIIKNIPKAKDEICTFLANCLEHDDRTAVTPDEVRKMKLGRFVRLLKEFFKRDDLVDFFGELAGFMGTDTSNSVNVSSGAIPIQNGF